MAAFDLAWKQEADGIEGDFRLTSDGHIVAIHDDDTRRVTGGTKDLAVAKSTLAELQSLDVGSWKDAKYSKERIPTLEDVLKSLPHDKLFLIEIKCGTEIMPALEKAIQQAEKEKPGISDRLAIICFNKEVVSACRRQLPQLPSHLLHGFRKDKASDKWGPTMAQIMSDLQDTKASGLDVQANPDRVTPDLVKQLRSAGMEFHCWTVNDLDLAKSFIGLGVDSITTNFPLRLRKELSE